MSIVKSKRVHAILAIGLITLLSSCATQPAPEAYDPPGFFFGLIHGMFAVFALDGHIFDDSIRIYAFLNSRGWYDFGFVLGIGELTSAVRS